MSVPVWIAVGLLGGIGALGRFVVDGVVATRIRRDFPLSADQKRCVRDRSQVSAEAQREYVHPGDPTPD